MEFKNFVVAFIVAVSFQFYCKAGNENMPAGARAAGMGNAAVTLTDMWSAFQNQAGLATLKGLHIGAFNQLRYGQTELMQNALVVALPLKDVGTFAVTFNQFGYSAYNEQKVGIAYARSFGKTVSAAMQLNYNGTNISDNYYGNNHAVTVEAGMRIILLPELTFGVHVYNPTRAALNNYNDERIPTTFKAGLGYQLNEKVLIAAEIEKTSETKPVFKTGFEYQFVKKMWLRAGFSTNQNQGYFGLGMQLKQLQINFAASFHQTLGFTPHADLGYNFVSANP
ncbi:MAG: hypothetical protein JNK61_01055 [Bacteroidia bacterium]|nr:hypothetical protein [Bacteroidia bacterium]HQU99691.1 hypothetical protein [Bacteroidia bacterium]